MEMYKVGAVLILIFLPFSVYGSVRGVLLSNMRFYDALSIFGLLIAALFLNIIAGMSLFWPVLSSEKVLFVLVAAALPFIVAIMLAVFRVDKLSRMEVRNPPVDSNWLDEVK